MGAKRQRCLSFYFIHHTHVERFVEAVAYLTAFYFLLEANNIGNYVCNVTDIPQYNGNFENLECSAIPYLKLFEVNNCSLSANKKIPPCTIIEHIGAECGYIRNKMSEIKPIELVAAELIVSMLALLILIFFVAEEETEEEKNERREWSKKGCKKWGMNWIKFLRTIACLLSFVIILLARIYYKGIMDRIYCKNISVTTSTGLLCIWPLTFLLTLLSSYPKDIQLSSPIVFRCIRRRNQKKLDKKSIALQSISDIEKGGSQNDSDTNDSDSSQQNDNQALQAVSPPRSNSRATRTKDDQNDNDLP